MFILIWKKLPDLLGCNGIVLFPFILFSDDKFAKDAQIMNHERIHVRQVLELCILPFYVLYIVEFLVRRCFSKSRYEAYRKISFEQEAYSNHHNLKYLKSRRPFDFIKYFF